MRVKFILTASMIVAVFHQGMALAGWQITASQEVHGGAVQSTDPLIVGISNLLGTAWGSEDVLSLGDDLHDYASASKNAPLPYASAGYYNPNSSSAIYADAALNVGSLFLGAGEVKMFGAAGEWLQAAKTVGSGPASGFLEVSDAYASSKAVQKFASPTATDFIFDSQSGRFIMGDGGVLGHDAALAAGRITPSETTVGGTIWRENRSLMTDEWSGHYGQNWTPEIRQNFQNFMQQHGVNITHTPWGQ